MGRSAFAPTHPACYTLLGNGYLFIYIHHNDSCLQGVFLFSVINFRLLTYNKTYEYPVVAQCFGVMLALISMIQVPLFAIKNIIMAKGSLCEVRMKRKGKLGAYAIMRIAAGAHLPTP